MDEEKVGVWSGSESLEGSPLVGVPQSGSKVRWAELFDGLFVGVSVPVLLWIGGFGPAGSQDDLRQLQVHKLSGARGQ